MKKIWWKEAVAYQIYPRSFLDTDGNGTGDLNGVTGKLDYLKELGIDLIWLSPMYRSPNKDNGYDISDYQEIMAEMGTMEDFDRLLKKVHERDMKLIIDLVINHTSDQHPWFIESRSSRDNPKRDWYVWRDQPTNWESIFGGPAWTFDPKTNQYFLHLFSKHQVDLNWENREMRKAIYDMVNWWLEKGVNGFRVDAINHLKKDYTDMPNPEGLSYVEAWEKMTNVEGLQDILKELRIETFDRYDIMTIGEANSVKSHELGEWISEDGGNFNMIFHKEAHHTWELEDERVDVGDLKEVLHRWQRSAHGIAWNSLYLENHDLPRTVSTWGNDKDYWRESATALACMYFFLQGTPFIYQGQEIGMTNAPFDDIKQYRDVETLNYYRYGQKKGISHNELMRTLRKTSRDHARTPMQWNSQAHGGFTKGEPWLSANPNYRWLNVDTQEQDSSSVLNFFKKMIQLRKKYETLVYGETELAELDCPEVYAYTRTYEQEKFLIISHLHSGFCSWEPIDGAKLLLANYEEHLEGKLQPFEARVYRLR